MLLWQNINKLEHAIKNHGRLKSLMPYESMAFKGIVMIHFDVLRKDATFTWLGTHDAII
jgi:hypothetical protein